jgi:hypothetical protein
MSAVLPEFSPQAQRDALRQRVRAAKLRSAQMRAVILSIAVLVAGYSVLSSNPILSLVSVAVLAFIVAMLWLPNQPPILLYSMFYQWLQVTMVVWQANGQDVGVAQMDRSIPLETAVWYALIGLIVVTGGMRLALSGMKMDVAARAIETAQKVDISKLIGLHIAVSMFATGFWLVVGGSALFQVAFAIWQLKMATLFAVGYVALAQKNRMDVFVLIFAFEFLSSVGAFFSDFRFPLIVAFLALVAAPGRPGFGRILGMGFLACGAIYAGVLWTAVKDQYRDYATAGSGQHFVSIDSGSARAKLVTLIGDVNSDVAAAGANQLANRLRYVDYLAHTIAHVPAAVPHENGALLGQAVLHVLTPRILFPDKPALVPDTEMTKKYTGLDLYAAQDTSISIGYFGDAYIDFGWPGMYIALLFVGLLQGFIYRTLVQMRNVHPLLCYGMAASAFLYTALFEITLIKLVGGLLSNFIVIYVLGLFVLPAISRLIVRRWTLESRYAS